MNSKIVIIIVVVLLVLCCCIGVGALLTGGLAIWGVSQIESPEFEFSATWEVPFVTSDPETPFADETPTPEFLLQPADEGAAETLETLKSSIVPNNDPRELAQRLKGISNIPEIMEAPEKWPQLNDSKTFWVSNVDTNENFEIEATLRYVGKNCYFWIQNDVKYDENDLKKLADTFDQEIYGTNREFFGSEWNPGIDQDPRLYVLFARGLGGNLAGYFSSADSVHPLAHEYSNAHEMFLMNADNVYLDEEFTYGVLAHEFQHMIHWYRDRNEESWLNEGFSELAAFLNGYDIGGFDYLFISDPDLQLNDWPNNPDATSPHYGAAFMFVNYFLDRFGEEATKALVANPDNGMDSVDNVLAQLKVTDPNSGKSIRADDVFADWAVTNILQDNKVADGRYIYSNYSNAPMAEVNTTISTCPFSSQNGNVKQYGTDYIRLDCPVGNYTLVFEGAGEVGVLPENAYSGDYAFWSNKGDESDMTLTQTFDLTGVTGPVTFKFWTWYDLETDYDYLYLEGSVDGGKTWEIIKTPSGTDQDPSGNSYGWGYNGVSEGWIEERVDLSDYVGKPLTLRFEYVTDAAVNGEGLLLDDISIPEIGYQSDFETDDGGWESAGFVRIENRLPQTYAISIIKSGSEKIVESHFIKGGERFSLPLSFNKEMEEAILVISGTTRFTRQTASYRFMME